MFLLHDSMLSGVAPLYGNLEACKQPRAKRNAALTQGILNYVARIFVPHQVRATEHPFHDLRLRKNRG